MSGYKQTVIDSDAASLWTFDGDAFDSGSRKLLVPDGDPNIIIDEIDNLNPAILHNDNETYLGYRLGLPSLIAFEQTDQHSMSFGFYGKQPAHPNQWAKAYLEIPHTISYSFPHLGSFTVELVFFKQSYTDEGSSAYSSFSRPIISKSGVFDIYFNFPYGGPYTLITTHPGGSASIPLTDFKGGFDLIGNTIHYVFVWSVTQEGGGQYQAKARVYINSYLASEQTYTYFDVFPNTNIANPILIAGRTGNNRGSDWHTSNFQIDQVAIYDRALTSDMVADHFSKIFPYDDMVKYEFCNNFWPFNDIDSTITFSVAPTVGSLTGSYIGVRNFNYYRGVNGPDNLLGAKASQFAEGGMASFISLNSNGAYIPRSITSEYSYELWFSVSPIKRAILLSSQELEYPFDGPVIQINMRDNQEVIGCLQFSEGDNARIFNSRYLNDSGNRFLYNDGNWHHIVVLRRTNGWVELWIDGTLHDSSIEATRTVSQPRTTFGYEFYAWKATLQWVYL